MVLRLTPIAPSRTPTPFSGRESSNIDGTPRNISAEPESTPTLYNNQLELYEAHGYPTGPDLPILPPTRQESDEQEDSESKVRLFSFCSCH